MSSATAKAAKTARATEAPAESTDSVIIRLDGITKRYGFGDTETFALQDFDLTVKRGEFIMIMGPSGCGKTTLLNIIGLIDRPTSGTYELTGKDVSRLKDRKKSTLRARKIGFVFQDFNLIPTLPVIDNVALPLVYAGYGRTHQLKSASSALGRFHLGEREYYLPSQLSGGQQQRVAIARAIVSDPDVILADEPTGNLDSRSAHIVMEELYALHGEGRTIIMVTHNPSLTTYATRVINMLDGHIDTDIKTVADSELPSNQSSNQPNIPSDTLLDDQPDLPLDDQSTDQPLDYSTNPTPSSPSIQLPSQPSPRKNKKRSKKHHKKGKK